MKKGEIPLIEELLSQFLGAIIIILGGIFLENSGQNRKSVLLTIAGLLLMIVTTSFDSLVTFAMGMYVLFGAIIAISKADQLYGLFGSKLYGSFLIAIIFLQTTDAQLHLNLIKVSAPADIYNQFFYAVLLTYWGAFALIAFAFGHLFKRRRKRR